MLTRVQERHPLFDFWGLENDVERIFGSVFAEDDLPTPTRSASFGFEVTPEKDKVVIRAEVPGVDPTAIKISVNDRVLTISGERAAQKPSEGQYHLRERSYGTFSRGFHLSEDLDSSAIEAECRDGVLTVRVPKRPESQPRQIAIKTS
jgi:HSP20 family protein